jgi:biopolymer transport protein ExbD
MTPMVDLGFLLIIFFMLAIAMSKPNSMAVVFPDKTPSDMDLSYLDFGCTIKETMPLTIFLGDHDQIYYLDGIGADDEKAAAALKTTRPGFELRNVIFASQKRARALDPSDDGNSSFVVVIKPTAGSTYKNMVDVIDEMAITKSRRYALVDDLTDAEKKLLGGRIPVGRVPGAEKK